MCANPEQFLKGYAERVQAVKTAVKALCDYGQENVHGACLPITFMQLALARTFIEPMTGTNSFVMGYCATHNVKVPKGFEVATQQVAEMTGVELRRNA